MVITPFLEVVEKNENMLSIENCFATTKSEFRFEIPNFKTP